MRQFFTLFLLIMLGVLPAVSQAADHWRPSGLRQAERLALERNPTLRAQTLATRSSALKVHQEYGLYDPVFSVEAAEGRNRERVNLTFLSDNPINITESRRLDFTLLQSLASGGELSLHFTNLREDSNSTSRLFDPSYSSAVGFRLIQPLLRGYGRTVAEQEIRLAIVDRNASLQQLRKVASDVLAEVRTIYFQVLRHRRDLAARQTSVDLAQKVLEENRARLAVGLLPEVEVLEARVALKQRQQDLLGARNAYREALDRLVQLLDLSSTEAVQELIDPADLEATEVAAGEEDGMSAALVGRPELLGQLRRLERLRLELQLATDRSLPALDLFAGYEFKGLGEDYARVIDDLGSGDLRDWEVGVLFSYPLGNRSAGTALRRAELELGRERALLARITAEIRNEIRSALRRIEIGSEQIEVGRLAVELSEERLRVLLKRKEVGLATTREVFEGEEDLAEAKSELNGALAGYHQAQTAYLRATGTLLAHEGVRFTGPLETTEEGALLSLEQP